MNLKRLSAALLSAAFALVAAAQPPAARPPKPKACCGPSCPESRPKKAPACCQLAPAQAPSAAIAAPAPLFVVVARVAPRPVLSDEQAGVVLSSGSDRSPPQRPRLAHSGLSPPRLA
jgi:hypothetical protein